jgi:hypothetical protein
MRTLGFWVPRLLILSAMAPFFGATFFYCFPNNPARMSLRPAVDWIGKYFAQNWSLFAPNPIQDNQALFVRCLTTEDVARGTSPDRLPPDGWRDITTALLRAHQRNRFSSYDRVSRTHSNFIRYFMQGSPALQALREACAQDGDKGTCRLGNQLLDDAHKTAALGLARVASSFCNSPGEAPHAQFVAISIQVSPVVPWSRRFDATPANEMGTRVNGDKLLVDEPKAEFERAVDYFVGVYPVDHAIEPVGLYTEGT